SLGTLTITLTEKSILSPAAMVASETVTMRIEVDDVEKSQQQAIKTVEEKKGRVTKSELKLQAGGQLEAIVEFEVPPKAAAEVQKLLAKLGEVTKQQADRIEQPEGGKGLPKDGKTREKDVQFKVAFNNVANVQPREVLELKIASQDVPSGFRKLEALAKATGRVHKALLNEQNKLNISAQLDFDILTTQKDA